MLAVELPLGLLPLCAGRIDFAAVEPSAFFLVANDMVGGRDLLEACFRRLIARMQIRMVLFSEPTVGLADVVLGRLASDAQDLEWVRHCWDPQALSGEQPLTRFQGKKNPAVANSMTAAANHPTTSMARGSVSRPMIRGFMAITIMTAISGAASTPLTTALQ